jgi:hypothetical protein
MDPETGGNDSSEQSQPLTYLMEDLDDDTLDQYIALLQVHPGEYDITHHRRISSLV